MGARYDVWCPPTPGGTLYLWALFEGVRTPPRMCTVMFDGGVFPLSVPPYVGGGRMEAHSGAGGSSSDLRSSTVIASGTVDVPIEADVSGGAGGATGTVDVWVGLQDESCPMSMDRPAPVYVLGLGARRALPDR